MQLTKEDIAYLNAQAQARGYSGDDLLKVINYESSGRPNAWGGKGGDYFGLIQFGPNERKTYGVDTVHPNARNQIDAAFRFLGDRGFKPGMGLQDLYSTVLAGSPGHYGRSDGAGTVSEHVAKMQGGATPGLSLSGGIPADALSFAGSQDQPTTAKSDPIADLLEAGGMPKQKQGMNLTSLVSSLLAEPDEQQQAPSSNDAFMRQMRDFHNAQHMRAVQGLL